MSARNKVSTNIETERIELEATINIRLDKFKYETVIYFDMKLSDIN